MASLESFRVWHTFSPLCGKIWLVRRRKHTCRNLYLKFQRNLLVRFGASSSVIIWRQTDTQTDGHTYRIELGSVPPHNFIPWWNGIKIIIIIIIIIICINYYQLESSQLKIVNSYFSCSIIFLNHPTLPHLNPPFNLTNGFISIIIIHCINYKCRHGARIFISHYPVPATINFLPALSRGESVQWKESSSHDDTHIYQYMLWCSSQLKEIWNGWKDLLIFSTAAACCITFTEACPGSRNNPEMRCQSVNDNYIPMIRGWMGWVNNLPTSWWRI